MNQKLKRLLGWGIVGAGLVATAPVGVAGESVTLAWNASPGTGLQYRLYIGGASQVYTNHLEAGTNLAATVTNLLLGATYYFAVTCYNQTGTESDFSNEVRYQVTPSAPAAPVLRLGEVRVEVPVTIWSATNLNKPHWRAVGDASAWLVLPATNPVEIFYATPTAEPGRQIGLGIKGSR